MARPETLANIEERIRILGELRPVRVSRMAMLFEINSSYAELYDKLSSANLDYFEKQHTYDVVSGTDNYNLPIDFYRCTGIDVKRNDSTWCTIEQYIRSERNFDTTYKSISREWTRYRIRGEHLVLIPTPQWSQSEGMRMLYIPACPKLVEDADTLDGISGWEDWIVFDCLTKLTGGMDEGDAREWTNCLARLNARIEKLSSTRNPSEPERIRNVEEEEIERIWPRHGAPP